MKNSVIVLTVVCASALCPAARAELQNVTVGGLIEIYGAWYSEFFEASGGTERIPAAFLPGRPIGLNGTVSAIRSDNGDHELSFVDQRTRLHVNADFTDGVRVFIQLEAVSSWGEDFRSDYITGADFITATDDDVEVYQAYIEANEVFGYPLRVRIGRQEMSYGSGWLVGTNPDPDPFTGLSFDAIRLTYELEDISIDAWWSKLAERFAAEEDGDIDFYGIYATYTPSGEAVGKPDMARSTLFPMHLLYCGVRRFGPFFRSRQPEHEELELDAYWMFVRDGASLNDSDLPAFSEWLEDLFSIDDYDVTELHTVGVRGAGSWTKLDWEAEAAYQWGEASTVGFLFPRNGGFYGDDDAEWDNWAGHIEVGYALDLAWEPRVYVGAHYYEGEDNRDISLLEWLVPRFRGDASVSFNRLFSDYELDAFLDGSGLSNIWMATAGVSGAPAETVELGLDITYQEVLETFDSPVYVSLGRWRIPIAPSFPFWTTNGEDDLGWQTTIWATYCFSPDLTFEAGWTHFFVGDAVQDGAFVDENGLTFIGGRDDEDADYVYFITNIAF